MHRRMSVPVSQDFAAINSRRLAIRKEEGRADDDDRQALIEAEIEACTECGHRLEFPKRSDCDGCIAAVDERLLSGRERVR